MRNPLPGLALFAVLASAGPAAAQSVKILDAKIGLPPGRFVAERDDNNNPAHVAKNNTWAPVYVELQLLKEERRNAAIVVEANDADDLGVSFAVPLQNLSDLPPGTRVQPTELRFLPYVRPGGRYDITVSVRELGDGKPTNWRQLSEPFRVRYLRTRDAAKYVVLSLGTNLPGFELPDAKTDDPNNLQSGGLRGGRIETAAITEVNQLPDRWFGYDAADLVVLTTGAASAERFLTPLFTDPQHRPRLNALVEWVRRGGRLVVSAGANAALVAQYELLQELLPVAVRRDQPAEQVRELNLEWALASTNARVGVLAGRQGAPFPVANVAPKPDRGSRQLVPVYDDAPGGAAGNRRRVVTQAAYGLGRVTFVAFDLDRSPFTDFPARAKFWDLVLKEGGSSRAAAGGARGNQNNYGYRGVGVDSEDDFAAGLRTHLDGFEGVPVISFGWVALFIVLYTLLIGPIEYLFLKKVLGRLELTWVTFPVIVLTVSAVAYFSAYALKGSDLMVNKVDVVDVDPASGRVYGRSWFSVFSPRIDTYRIGVEPNDGWAAADPPQPHPGALVDWLGTSRSGGRGGSFFRRSYFYEFGGPPDGPADARRGFANGLVDVPIQVWSTKAFAADWSAYTDRANPLVASSLVHPPSDPRKVAGTFTLNLALPPLADAYLIYAGKAYRHDNPISPGVPVTILLDKEDPDWLTKVGSGSMVTALANQTDRRSAAVPGGSAQLFGMLFHDAQPGGEDRPPVNATLRRLDQSWRLTEQNRDEVILVARLATERGAGTVLVGEPNSPSPTKLWLKDLPGGGKPWPGLTGTVRQETFVRVYVPVKPAARR